MSPEKMATAEGHGASVAQSGAWQLLHQVVRLVYGLAIGIAIARHLDPQGFGHYQFVLSWVLLFWALGGAGLQSVLVQRLSVETDAGRILGTSLRIRLITGAISAAVCIALAWLLVDEHDLLLGIVLLSPIAILQAFDVIDAWLVANMMGRRLAIVRLSSLAISAIMVVIGLLTKQSWLWFASAYLVEVGSNALALWFANGVPKRQCRFDYGTGIKLWRMGWPMLFSTMAFYLYNRLDIIMLGQLSTADQTGWYAASSRLAQTWVVLPLVVVNAAFPALARSMRSDAQKYTEQQGALFVLLGSLGWAVVAVVLLSSPWVVPLLFGPAYQPTVAMIALHGWIALLYFLRTGLDRLLVNERLVKWNMMHHISMAGLNVFFNYALIPTMGGRGAVFASLLSMGIGGLLLPWAHTSLHPVMRRVWLGLLGPLVLLFQPSTRKALVDLARQGVDKGNDA